MISAVIFDLDGLILDSETPEVLAWQETYARYGLEFPLDRWLLNVGRIDSPWDAYAALRALDPPVDLALVRGFWRGRHDLHAREYRRPLPGVMALLTAVRARGWRTAVASSSQRASILRALEGLNLAGQFNVTAGGDEVRRAKPAPDVYLLAAQRLGVAPEACVALEDSHNGVQAAKAAGMACIAVPSALTRSLDFSAADLVVHSLEAVTPETIAALARAQA
jgi:HAD superfamily hydrolase (TIGR01509 family)